jgi:hypothetical protein
MILVANVIRTVLVVLSVVSAAIALRAVWDDSYRDRAQMCRFVGLAVLLLSVSFGGYHAIGRSPYWPVLGGNVIGVIISLCGTWPMVMGGIRRRRILRSDSRNPRPEATERVKHEHD